jgi:hypothetical protein
MTLQHTSIATHLKLSVVMRACVPNTNAAQSKADRPSAELDLLRAILRGGVPSSTRDGNLLIFVVLGFKFLPSLLLQLTMCAPNRTGQAQEV